VPNQQLDDFVPWIINTLGRKKFYLIGANYIYPKETNREVKALLQKHGGTTVAEEYSPLGSTEFSTNINKIASSGCDIVFSDLVGDQIVAFYKQFKEFGITANDIPICSPVTTEQEIEAMGGENAVGHYSSNTYFQTLDTPHNKSFVQRYKEKYGKDQVTNAVMECAYNQTYFLAQAIEKVKSTDPDALIFRRIAGTGVRECTRWQSQGRRKESSCLAVAAYRSGQTRWPPLRSVEIGRLGPSAAVGSLPLSKQDLRLHRQAGARPPEETVERGEEPVGNDQFVTR
jgi:urea transport system substrate-binding protein